MAEFVNKSKEFFFKCARVWAVTRKPTKDEFKLTAQSAGFGMLLVGLIGFLISIFIRLFVADKLFVS